MTNSQMIETSQQLHLIQNQFSFDLFTLQIERLVSSKDTLLFLNDSVFMLLENDFRSNKFTAITKNIEILCIDEQTNARGISELVSNNIKLINYQDFVRISQSATKVVSW